MRKVLLLFICTLQITLCLSQNISRKKDCYIVNVNGVNCFIRAEVMNEPISIAPKENVYYSWYSSNKIMETKGGYDGKLLNGAFTSFYYNNNLKEKGTFYKGLKEGKWIEWFENGIIREISHWKKGLKHGSLKTYNETGQIIYEAFLKNNLLNGMERRYESSKVISEKKYTNGVEYIPTPLPEKVKETKPKEIKEPVKKEENKTTVSEKSNKQVTQKGFSNWLKNTFHKKEKKAPVIPEATTPLKKKSFWDFFKVKPKSAAGKGQTKDSNRVTPFNNQRE